jgi:dTDP-4-dehydrorhamnose 3,5-epimerase
MDIQSRKLKGVFEITLKPILDQRGFFMRTYDLNIMEQFSLHKHWVQENHSRSDIKGTIRGLHFQLPPYTETKLIRCIQGVILDVFVDLRENSETFGQWDAVELNAANKKMILIPRGFAHGFCTLTDISEVIYKVDNFYSKESEQGLLWNDPDLGITWPYSDPVLSEKDKHNFTFKEFTAKYKHLNIQE